MTNTLYSVLGSACNKMLIGKTFWKGLAMPGFLYAQEVLNYSNSELESLQRADNKAHITILQVPNHTAVGFLRGEIGASSARGRDIKTKLLFIKHAIKNPGNALLKSTMIKELNENDNKLAKRLNAYMNDLNINLNYLETHTVNQIKTKINEYDSELWKQSLRDKATLNIYQCGKKRI